MTTEKYQTTKGATRYRPVLTESEAWACDNDSIGFCLACGEERGECEPDARNYECEACGAPYVYGTAELVIMGIAKIVD